MIKKAFKSLLSINSTSITIWIILFVLVLFAFRISILEMIELKTYDLRFLSRGIRDPSPTVVLAVIDEKSLNVEGRWPWPRSKIAKIVDILSEDGAKVIGFDIGFLEPDENSRLQLIQQLEEKIETFQIRDQEFLKFLEESKIEADNDLALAKAIKRSNAKVVLGYWFYMDQAALNYEIDQETINRQLKLISKSEYPITLQEKGLIEDPFVTAYAPGANIQILTEAAKSSGYVNYVSVAFEEDTIGLDGIIRSSILIVKCGEHIYAPLAIQCVRNYLDQPELIVKVADYGITGIQMGKMFIPTDENGKLLINFLGPQKTFPHYSLSDILNHQTPKGTFKDKIVIVGATALGIGDIVNTPYSITDEYPGPEIHATIIDNILNKNKWR